MTFACISITERIVSITERTVSILYHDSEYRDILIHSNKCPSSSRYNKFLMWTIKVPTEAEYIENQVEETQYLRGATMSHSQHRFHGWVTFSSFCRWPLQSGRKYPLCEQTNQVHYMDFHMATLYIMHCKQFHLWIQWFLGILYLPNTNNIHCLESISLEDTHIATVTKLNLHWNENMLTSLDHNCSTTINFYITNKTV